MTSFEVDVQSERLEAALQQASIGAADLRDVWLKADERFTSNIVEQFGEEGTVEPSPGQQEWESLSPRYAAQKQRESGIRESIMQRSGQLKESLANPQDTGAVHEVNRLSYERGTQVTSDSGYPYPAAHHEGRGDLPKRPILAWTDSDTEWLTERAADHLTEPLE